VAWTVTLLNDVVAAELESMPAARALRERLR
jgi:hypothetical protein